MVRRSTSATSGRARSAGSETSSRRVTRSTSLTRTPTARKGSTSYSRSTSTGSRSWLKMRFEMKIEIDYDDHPDSSQSKQIILEMEPVSTAVFGWGFKRPVGPQELVGKTIVAVERNGQN